MSCHRSYVGPTDDDEAPRPEEFVFTFTRTADRDRLGVITISDESLVRHVGGLIYVPVIARCMERRRVLGQEVAPMI